MKLNQRIIAYISVASVVLFTLWAVFFYIIGKRSIYKQVDTVLEQQSSKIINHFLLDESLPDAMSGITGTMAYSIEKVAEEYLQTHPSIEYQTTEKHIDFQEDKEKVRELTRTFRKQGVCYKLAIDAQVYTWNDTIDFVIYSIIGLAVILLTVVILIVSLTVIDSMRPLYRLTEWVRNREVNEEIPKPDSHIKTQEIKEIESAVLEASERSNQLFEEQKRFIGNASHEIQTPLAVCRNRLELLVDNTQLDEHQLSEIEKTLNTLNYISRLNKSLLLLSKIENHQFKEEVEVDINLLVADMLENLKEIYGNLGIKTSFSEKGRIITHMSPTLASSLVSNLLKNAFVHNRPNGSITVETIGNILTICNTGDDEALDEKAIFQTFYKRSDNATSSGIGLAIAKSICNEYGFETSYHFVDNQHCFSIKFK